MLNGCRIVGNREEFAYSKLKNKRNNKQGCYILRENHASYDELCLDVCLVDGEPATTFIIDKSAAAGYAVKGFAADKFARLADLLAHHQTHADGRLHLKECLPSSENGTNI